VLRAGFWSAVIAAWVIAAATASGGLVIVLSAIGLAAALRRRR
jgi:hypothetical protein